MQRKVGTERGETQRLVRAAARTAAQDERMAQDRIEGWARGKAGRRAWQGQNIVRGRSIGRAGQTVGHRKSRNRAKGTGQGRAEGQG